MNENDIVEIAKQEYEKICEEYDTIKGFKIKEFNEKELNYNILKEIEATALDQEFNEEAIFREIRGMMKTLNYDERKELLIETKKEIANEKTRRVNHNIRKTGITEILSELPEEEIEKTLETFKEVIEKRRTITKTPNKPGEER